MTKRFYIGKKEDYFEDLEEWISDKIGSPPPETWCECKPDLYDEANAEVKLEHGCEGKADTYMYHIEGEHICYTWLCTPCMESQVSETYLGDYEGDIPVTAGGYAAAPRHCS